MTWRIKRWPCWQKNLGIVTWKRLDGRTHWKLEGFVLYATWEVDCTTPTIDNSCLHALLMLILIYCYSKQDIIGLTLYDFMLFVALVKPFQIYPSFPMVSLDSSCAISISYTYLSLLPWNFETLIGWIREEGAAIVDDITAGVIHIGKGFHWSWTLLDRIVSNLLAVCELQTACTCSDVENEQDLQREQLQLQDAHNSADTVICWNMALMECKSNTLQSEHFVLALHGISIKFAC